MIAWINFMVLGASLIFFTLFYIRSVSPAFFETRQGERAYKICGIYRTVSMLFMTLALVNYILYYFYPLPTISFVPQWFPWSWWVSLGIALVIGIPSGLLMTKGMLDAGKELAIPDKSHSMYGGIYLSIRHPQAAGEVFLFLVTAFILHSPFLALFSLAWFPIFYLISLAEEKDLVLRFGEAYVAYQKETGMFFPRKKG